MHSIFILLILNIQILVCLIIINYQLINYVGYSKVCTTFLITIDILILKNMLFFI